MCFSISMINHSVVIFYWNRLLGIFFMKKITGEIPCSESKTSIFFGLNACSWNGRVTLGTRKLSRTYFFQQFSLCKSLNAFFSISHFFKLPNSWLKKYLTDRLKLVYTDCWNVSFVGEELQIEKKIVLSIYFLTNSAQFLGINRIFFVKWPPFCGILISFEICLAPWLTMDLNFKKLFDFFVSDACVRS